MSFVRKHLFYNKRLFCTRFLRNIDANTKNKKLQRRVESTSSFIYLFFTLTQYFEVLHLAAEDQQQYFEVMHYTITSGGA